MLNVEVTVMVAVMLVRKEMSVVKMRGDVKADLVVDAGKEVIEGEK
jgi:hypothetical protein